MTEPRLSEVCERYGLSTVAIRNWAQRGYLWELDGAGKGNHRRLTGEQVRLVRLTARIVAHGIQPAGAAEYARAMLATGERHPTVDLGSPVIALSMDLSWLDEPPLPRTAPSDPAAPHNTGPPAGG